MARYFLKIAFDGTHYHGWQVQPNANTVQAEVNHCLRTLLQDHEISCMGCGRTDTGVHAREFYLHFDTIVMLPNDIVYKANAILPNDIVVFDCIEVPDDHHARFDAVERTYKYYISNKKEIFSRYHVWQNTRILDIDFINEQLTLFKGDIDCTAFSKSNTQTHTNMCKIVNAKWVAHEGNYVFTITANRFLRNMVRSIVGTCVQMSDPKGKIKDFQEIIASKSRSRAGVSVPAHGLFLHQITYPSIPPTDER